MDDILLLDAIERYKKGEMTAQEKTFFEEMRKNNPEIDQLAVEHTFFLNELERVGDRKLFKHTLDEVENTLVNEGIIAKKQIKTKAKIVYLWNRYRRTIAVAACIAAIVSISTATIVSMYSEHKQGSNLTLLVAANKIKKIEAQVDNLRDKLDSATAASSVRPKFEGSFSATAFLIDGNGYLATNAHVVNNANHLVIENKKGEQFTAIPVYVDKVTDLAILKVTDTSFRKISILPYSIRKTSSLLGTQIFTLGYPREEIVYGEGYLSAKSGYSGDTTSYQISISVNPGNSGGPVLNKNGEVIAIITSKEKNADGVVFAIKSKNIYTALQKIKSTELIKLPASNGMNGLDRESQIKKLEDCVFMVKGN
jgi:S1-C subfamily serine protease